MNLFWSIKNSGKVVDKLKARDFNTTSLSTYVFFTLYTTLPHISIKDNVLILLKEPSKEKALLTLHATTDTPFSLQESLKYQAWSCQNVCDALTFLLDNIYI